MRVTRPLRSATRRPELSRGIFGTDRPHWLEMVALIPSGESPDGTGGSPVLPTTNFKIRSSIFPVLAVVHSIHFPVSARNFVMPMVDGLNRHGLETELWFEHQAKHQAVIRQITVPSRPVDSDFSFAPLVFNRRLAAYRGELRKSPPRILHVHQARASLI